MSELELYKFLRSHNVSSYRIDEREKNEPMYLVWLYFWGIEEFIKLVGEHHFDEGGVDVRLQQDGICVDLGDFDLEIELKNVFTDC